MVLRTQILSGFVLFTSIPRSFGFLSWGSFPIKTAVCFSASFLPSALAGLLGYGYGEGSCAAYPFRYFKKKYNPTAERSTYQIMESYMKQSQVKISEVGGRLPSHGSLLLRVWILSAFGETKCDFLMQCYPTQKITVKESYFNVSTNGTLDIFATATA